MIKFFQGIRPDLGRRLSAVLGFITIAASTMFICGYAFGEPALYVFPKGASAVALPTSILFFLLGNAVYILSVTREHDIVQHLEPDEQRLGRLEREISELKLRITKARK